MGNKNSPPSKPQPKPQVTAKPPAPPAAEEAPNSTATAGEAERKAAVATTGSGKGGGGGATEVDLAFVLDTTGSMGSYIRAAQHNIKTIVARVHKELSADVRFGLVSYKDYDRNVQELRFSRFGPNSGSAASSGSNGFADRSAARIYDFTSDVSVMQEYVDRQKATGGGDGPEAVATAFHCTELLGWREGAAKIAVLITDAPPHGIEPTGDDYPNGDPQCRDVLVLARALADKDITLYTVACEPSVTSNFKFCRDFLESVADLGGGMLVPLKSASLLTDMILASCKEGADLAKVQAEVQAALAALKAENPNLRGEALAERAAEKLAAAGVEVHQTRDTANAYANFDRSNVTRLKNATSLRKCKRSLAAVAAPRGWAAGLESQQIRSEVSYVSASQCSRMMTKHARKKGWGF